MGREEEVVVELWRVGGGVMLSGEGRMVIVRRRRRMMRGI